MARRVVEHLEQHPELDAVGMRLDLARRRRKLVVRPAVFLRLAFGGGVRQLDVRIGDDRLLDVLVDRRPAFLVPPLDFHRHLGPPWEFPGDLLLLEYQRLVLLGVDLDFEVVGRRPRAGTRDDLDRLTGRELPVHAGRRDADALLSSAHAEPMELGAVQELREDPRNLLANDAGAVVGDGDPEAARLARRRWGPAVGDGLQLHDHLREDSGFLAGVEGVVDGLFDAGEERLSGVVEAQEMTVLGEELGHRDLSLARTHLDGGHPRLRFGRRRRPRLRRLRGRRPGLRGAQRLTGHISSYRVPNTELKFLSRQMEAIVMTT